MIKPIKEVNRMPGYLILGDSNGANPDIMGGMLVRLTDASTVTLADGSLSSASNSVLGVAADTSAMYAAGAKYTITDDYAKNGLMGVFIDGGVFEVWNDSRGAIFADDCINAAVGAPLYVTAAGIWSITPTGAGTVGASAIGKILSAPTSASGVLKIKVIGL